MTKVKICGLMEPEHVQAAVQAGADAIGFVFAPSRRRITLKQAKQLARLVPEDVMKIGVFVNPSPEEVMQAYHEVPLDFIQYHGNESLDFIKSIGLPSIKVVSMHSEKDNGRIQSCNTQFVLVDTPGIEYNGGTGKVFDWSLLEGDLPRHQLILAGGLTVGNVQEAIRQIRPAMVDVSSGVERNNRKDEALIRAFIRAVKEEER
ncbi:phosphoribosylanthranilate isomerase [Sporosarcina sp. Te-1]|uniref:phosphoribosylanthranilate isomerase n=1 Tax=Sporosarcina sp. Te-1 TaxID=2818390 RepID=UPI001A9D9298|nr:phosphoribosylanthranilate isomerase [Sporosarcina sp. Te-1]QTD40011.1 phosphoribosylanthranilate isomerase [Sporosarcina sp. Te-1]